MLMFCAKLRLVAKVCSCGLGLLPRKLRCCHSLLRRAGVIAGKAAGMQVVAVPSLPGKDARSFYATADVQLTSLLDLQPEVWGLPPFEDRKPNVNTQRLRMCHHIHLVQTQVAHALFVSFYYRLNTFLPLVVLCRFSIQFIDSGLVDLELILILHHLYICHTHYLHCMHRALCAYRDIL